MNTVCPTVVQSAVHWIDSKASGESILGEAKRTMTAQMYRHLVFLLILPASFFVWIHHQLQHGGYHMDPSLLPARIDVGASQYRPSLIEDDVDPTADPTPGDEEVEKELLEIDQDEEQSEETDPPAAYHPQDIPLDSPLDPRYVERHDTSFGYTPVPFFHNATTEFQNDGNVAVVTQMSLDKWPRLVTLAGLWEGPISCAVFLRGSKERQKLLRLLREESLPALAAIHILELDEAHVHSFRDNDYPMNRLRNLALDYATTEYVLPLDVDFLPSVDSYRKIQRRMKVLANENGGKTKGLLILPAFERFAPPKGVNESSIIVPLAKTELVASIQRGESAPFHEKIYKPGHQPTNFPLWYERWSRMYRIVWRPRFEPYVVATREGLPPYWDGFTGKHPFAWACPEC
jgi:Glycosyl-transferase for dystroglycan